MEIATRQRLYDDLFKNYRRQVRPVSCLGVVERFAIVFACVYSRASTVS